MRTITNACSYIDPGGTIWLRSGVYAESLESVIPSGTEGAVITIRSYDAELAIIKADSGNFVIGISNAAYITLQNLIIDAENIALDGLKITTNSHHITVSNVEVKNALLAGNVNQGILVSNGANNILIDGCSVHDNGDGGQSHGIYLSEVGDCTVRNCNCYNNSGHGIHVYGGSNDSLVTLIELNYCHDNDDCGIGVYYGQSTVVNNICRRNVHNLYIRYSVKSVLAAFNTLTDAVIDGICLMSLFQASADVQIKNNVVTNSPKAVWVRGADNSATAHADLVNNLFSGNTLDIYEDAGMNLDYTETGTVSATFTPVTDDTADLIDPTAGNPAIGAGVAVVGVTTDYAGTTRANPPSIGAYE